MNLQDLCNEAQTGDFIAVHGTDAEQKAIQFATCNPLNHIAGLVRPPSGGLLIVEFVEPGGYESLTLDDWLSDRQGQDFYFGRAPDVVRQNAALILADLQRFSDAKQREYAFDTLAIVKLSDITGKTYTLNGFVCSTFWQHEFEVAGYPTPGNASPGDFMRFAESLSFIKP